MNHQKYLLLLGGKSYLAPLPVHMDKILDVGTGTGIWAIDMADQFPAASIIGTDIAPVQPEWVPPNCQFQLDDAEQDWTFAPASFDYIHVRDMYLGIRDWAKFMRQAYDALKPGGYVELVSPHGYPTSDDNSLPDDAAFRELCTTLAKMTVKYGCDPRYCEKWQKQLEEAGFVDVTLTLHKLPSSPWPKDPILKKIGAFEYLNICEGTAGFLVNKYTEWTGKSMQDLQMMVLNLKRELALNKFHCYIPQ
jgi:SAM-dependent methyltransferase